MTTLDADDPTLHGPSATTTDYHLACRARALGSCSRAPVLLRRAADVLRRRRAPAHVRRRTAIRIATNATIMTRSTSSSIGPTLKGMRSSLAATGNGRAMSEAYTPENLVDWMSDPADARRAVASPTSTPSACRSSRRLTHPTAARRCASARRPTLCVRAARGRSSAFGLRATVETCRFAGCLS